MYKEVEEYINKIDEPKENIVEILIVAQEKLGKLSNDHINFLSELCNISFEEIKETIEFFPFLIGDNVVFKVCNGFYCSMKGSNSISSYLKEKELQVEKVPCSGRCKSSPNIWADDLHYGAVDLKLLNEIIDKKNKKG